MLRRCSVRPLRPRPWALLSTRTVCWSASSRFSRASLPPTSACNVLSLFLFHHVHSAGYAFSTAALLSSDAAVLKKFFAEIEDVVALAETKDQSVSFSSGLSATVIAVRGIYDLAAAYGKKPSVTDVRILLDSHKRRTHLSCRPRLPDSPTFCLPTSLSSPLARRPRWPLVCASCRPTSSKCPSSWAASSSASPRPRSR